MSILVIESRPGFKQIALRCAECDGRGSIPSGLYDVWDRCEDCDGHGYFGLDPSKTTTAQPGSEAKVAILAARYSDGLPLWNDLDHARGYTDDEEKEFRFGLNRDENAEEFEADEFALEHAA